MRSLVTRRHADDGTPIYTPWLDGIPVTTMFSLAQVAEWHTFLGE